MKSVRGNKLFICAGFRRVLDLTDSEESVGSKFPTCTLTTFDRLNVPVTFVCAPVDGCPWQRVLFRETDLFLGRLTLK